jgi:hypothetical protein
VKPRSFNAVRKAAFDCKRGSRGVVGECGHTGGSCASEAEGENSHGDCTMTLAAVDGGVGCENVGYRFGSVKLGGHIELAQRDITIRRGKGIAQ